MRTVLAATLITLCSLPVLTGDALACINGVELHIDEGKRLVARADRALGRGRYRDAIRDVDRALGKANAPTVVQRAELIRATAVVRSNGKYALRLDGKKLRGDAAVRVSTHKLRSYVEKTPAVAPRWRAALAEGLEATGDAPAALEILEDLARLDLVPDAHAFASLARLRAGAGDGPGRASAESRCRQMGGGGICHGPRS